MSEYPTRQFEDLEGFYAYLIDMGINETVTAIFPIKVEDIPRFSQSVPITVATGLKQVEASIEMGSHIDWAEEEEAWIATLLVQVFHILVRASRIRRA